MRARPRMPALFVGHGSPMNALEHNRFTRAWHDFARSAPRPRAILAISAHWYVPMTAVTAMARPRTIHDFSGFPEALSAFEYPAPGDPALAQQVCALLEPVEVVAAVDTWGLDHGSWSVLAHLFPDADVPVVALSIDRRASAGEHVARGAALAPLRDEGVLVMASGNVVHNLGALDRGAPDGATDWNTAFDDAARTLMTTRPVAVTELEHHPAYRLAAPSPDHLVPLYYVAGLASAAGSTAEVLVAGPTLGSLSMTSYVV
ncbi:MAG: 4,5-DOPA dioxygenase extradiol [Actinomycetes bacterium]